MWADSIDLCQRTSARRHRCASGFIGSQSESRLQSTVKQNRPNQAMDRITMPSALLSSSPGKMVGCRNQAVACHGRWSPTNNMRLFVTFLLFFASASLSTATDGKTVRQPVPMPSAADVEIIIVDGIWGVDWDLGPLCHRLRGVAPTRIWHYDNSGLSSLEKAGAALAAKLKAVHRPFFLVGFSMGGLVIREAMRQSPGLPLRKAVFLNSPHSGSLLAYLLPLPVCREIRPNSAFLRRLNASAWNYPTMVTWCPGDLMVVPGESARWTKATFAIHCSVPAHIWPLVSPAIQRSVADFLKN